MRQRRHGHLCQTSKKCAYSSKLSVSVEVPPSSKYDMTPNHRRIPSSYLGQISDFRTQALGWKGLAATPLWVTPVASPSLAHTPRQRLAAPQWAPRRWPWDPRSSPTSRGSQGSELRSSTRPGAAGAAVVPKRWWLPTDQTICRCAQGCASFREERALSPGKAGDRQEGPRRRKDRCPLHVLPAGDLLDPRPLLQLYRRMSLAFRGTPHPTLSLVPLREHSERL